MVIKKKTGWLVLLLVSLLVVSAILAGCSTPATIATTATSTLIPSLSGTITESGSTTVQPLAEKLAAAFMKINPGVKVVIQGGGTAVGIKAANDGTVDIGAASRELTKDDPALVKAIICKDGIGIIVNPANKVSDLTKAQIIDIFSGKITNWNQVGGDNKDIHVAAREEGSGTRTAFQDLVMGKDASGNPVSILKSAILQNSSGAILQVVKSDAQSISFDSFGYLDPSVKALSIGGAAASVDNARNGTYPIVRPLYFLTKTQPAGIIKAFLDYCNGTDAQKIVSSEGYIQVN
jgi:phosphate transport system substrate-binding protein